MTADREESQESRAEGILTFEEILGMTREEAARVAGGRAWDIAHLGRLVSEEIATTPEPPAKPPSFFVSYRWESDAHDAWVARLVRDLKARGYEVLFDRDLQAGREEPLPVPELIRLMARCNRFLIVWSSGYAERTEPDAERGAIRDGWVWDEYQTALHLTEAGRMRSWLIVWRSGALPEWVKPDQAWDFRDDAHYAEQLDAAFPRRMARIYGIRPDGTARVVGPVERSRVNEFGRQLEATGEFERFMIEHL